MQRGVIRPDFELCVCGAYRVRYSANKIIDTLVRVETVEIVATGGQTCRFKITLK